MNTTVITVDVTDYGVGETDRVTFVDTKYHKADDGDLHIQRDNDGNIACFPKGTWRSVVRGRIVASGEVTQVEK
jgi:hypothetical protein